MSTAALYALWPNTDTPKKLLCRFQNAHGLAPFAWNVLAQKYMQCGQYEYMRVIDELWKLHEQPHVTISDRVVLRMTFDNAYILKEDVPLAIDDIALFLHANKQYISVSVVNHWSHLATRLATQWRDDPAAFGVHMTSVSENPWDGPYDEEKDERKPFDWRNAYSVYTDELRRPRDPLPAVRRV